MAPEGPFDVFADHRIRIVGAASECGDDLGCRRCVAQGDGDVAQPAGVADAADTTFTSVSGDTVEAIVLYKDTGDAATSPLIAYIDTATGLPLTPNGGDVTITWDNGANKIFKL